MAFRVVQQITGQVSADVESESALSRVRSEAGRAGGLKGGKARKAALTPERRSEIAKTAAEVRWHSGESGE